MKEHHNPPQACAARQTRQTEGEFYHTVMQTFDQLMQHLERQGIDFQDTPESLHMRWPQGVYLLNIQKALRQLWVSSPISGAHHFSWCDGQWVSTRQALTLTALLAQEQGLDLSVTPQQNQG